jgi:sugar phosphate permease
MRARAAWLMWSIPAALFLVAFFHRNAPGVMARDLMETFGITGAVIGLLSSTYFYAYAGFMIPGGMLLEAFGARRVVAAGGALMGLGTLAMGAAGGAAALFAGRFGVGLGATVTFIGTLKIAAAWFPAERFGFLSAVTATVGVLGAFVASAPLAGLMALAGWRGALTTIGVLTLAGSLLCLAVVRDAPGGAAPPPAPALGGLVRGMGRVLANVHTWPVFLSFFCLYSAMGNLFLWAVPFLRDVYGLTTSRAATIAAATSVALLASAPLTGFVSDSVVRRRKAPYVALSAALLAVWTLFLGTLGTVPVSVVAALFFGLGVFGGAFVLTWPIGREVNAPELGGLAVTVVNLGGFLGAALTQAPLGAVLDARWAGSLTAGGARAYPLDAYRVAFAICAAFVLGATLLSLLLRETYGRNVWPQVARNTPGRT